MVAAQTADFLGTSLVYFIFSTNIASRLRLGEIASTYFFFFLLLCPFDAYADAVRCVGRRQRGVAGGKEACAFKRPLGLGGKSENGQVRLQKAWEALPCNSSFRGEVALQGTAARPAARRVPAARPRPRSRGDAGFPRAWARKSGSARTRWTHWWAGGRRPEAAAEEGRWEQGQRPGPGGAHCRAGWLRRGVSEVGVRGGTRGAAPRGSRAGARGSGTARAGKARPTRAEGAPNSCNLCSGHLTSLLFSLLSFSLNEKIKKGSKPHAPRIGCSPKPEVFPI